MEYLILNEESLPFNSISDCKTHLPEFFTILIHAFKHNMKSLRVTESFDSGWYNLQLADNFFLRDWVTAQENDYKTRLKTIINKTDSPQIPLSEIEAAHNEKLSEFLLKHDNRIQTPSLGAALLLNQLAISFRSHSCWDDSEIDLLKDTLQNDGSFAKEECVVKNTAQFFHWEKHFAVIEKERKENYKKGRKLWEQRTSEFPNCIFCSSTENQFKRLSINKATYDKLWDVLKNLDNSIADCSNNDELKGNTGLDFSYESNTVQNNPKLKRFRMITLPDGRTEFFGLHIKNFPDTMRLHFLPDYKAKKIYIGYFGKHLPTNKY